MAAADAVSPVPFFAFPFLWLQIMLFIQQWSLVGFDEFMKVQAGRAWHADVFVVIRIVFNLSVLTCGLASFIPLHMLFIEKKTRSVGLLAPGSACVNWNVLLHYSRNIESYSICLDVKCSNSSNHRRLVSVPVPRIRDVSLLCYRFQSERITETVKWSNV